MISVKLKIMPFYHLWLGLGSWLEFKDRVMGVMGLMVRVGFLLSIPLGV